MKNFAIAFAVVGALALAGCGNSASCKKALCAPACDLTKQFCDTSFTCVDLKTCTPACKTDGTEYCDGTKGTCVKLCSPACAATEFCDNGACKALPTVKTCSPACTATQYCDGTEGKCKDTPVCSPVCDATKGEVCTNT